jgi:hypothetical protein
LEDERFSPHFNGCIGVIDGTHIPIIVLAIYDFDLRFTFVVAGWMGSTHDTRVFNDALERYVFTFPLPPQDI